MTTQPTAWCPDCARTRTVEEYDRTDDGDRYTTGQTYVLTRLECGHTVQETTGTYGDQLADPGLSRAHDLDPRL